MNYFLFFSQYLLSSYMKNCMCGETGGIELKPFDSSTLVGFKDSKDCKSAKFGKIPSNGCRFGLSSVQKYEF